MMTVVHLLMFGFILGAALSVLHYVTRRWAETRDMKCPRAKIARTVSRAARLGVTGVGAYFLATIGWAALPAALTGYFVTKPALAPVREGSGA